MANKLIELIDIYKSFPGVSVFSGFDFDLYEREIHCIVGENGAGKSTLIKILSGAIKPDKGEIRVCGKTYHGLNPYTARHMSIQTIYQDPMLISSLTVAENIFLGNEVMLKAGIIDRKKAIREAYKIIEKLDIDVDPNALVENIGIAGKQATQILKALAMNAKVLILDEPTATFSNAETEKLLKLIKQIRDTGVGIIFISHHLQEVFDIADRITVIKDGVKTGEHINGDVTVETLIKEMIGKNASLLYKKKRSSVGETVLKVDNIARGDALKDISFELKKGEILGIGGMVGSGRTELLRAIIGHDKTDSGEITYLGKKIKSKSPAQALKNGICMLPEDRQKRGLNIEATITDNIVLPSLEKIKGLILREKNETTEAQKSVDILQIKTPSLRQAVKNLSGGNQQKVVISKWLLYGADIYLFDEPTCGVDVGTKVEIYKQMESLVEEGKSIIFVSSDMMELIGLSDRILIMRNGSIVIELQGNEINEERILTCSIGGEGECIKIEQ